MITKAYEQIPEENKVVTCPYCHKAQNPFNIPLQMVSNTEWVAKDCDHCGKLFGYMQFVERIYIAASIKEESK